MRPHARLDRQASHFVASGEGEKDERGKVSHDSKRCARPSCALRNHSYHPRVILRFAPASDPATGVSYSSLNPGRIVLAQ